MEENETGGRDMELNDLIKFAKAYNDLGTSVQGQLDDLLDDPRNAELNGNAVDRIEEQLVRRLSGIDLFLGDELAGYIDEWREGDLD